MPFLVHLTKLKEENIKKKKMEGEMIKLPPVDATELNGIRLSSHSLSKRMGLGAVKKADLFHSPGSRFRGRRGGGGNRILDQMNRLRTGLEINAPFLRLILEALDLSTLNSLASVGA